jgi:DNA-binding protein YbaB
MQQQPSGMQQQQQQQQQQEHQQKMAQASSNFITTFVAGGAAGLLAALITCPVEVVKTKLQVSCTLPHSLITSSRLNPHHTRPRLRIRRFFCTP